MFATYIVTRCHLAGLAMSARRGCGSRQPPARHTPGALLGSRALARPGRIMTVCEVYAGRSRPTACGGYEGLDPNPRQCGCQRIRRMGPSSNIECRERTRVTRAGAARPRMPRQTEGMAAGAGTGDRDTAAGALGAGPQRARGGYSQPDSSAMRMASTRLRAPTLAIARER